MGKQVKRQVGLQKRFLAVQPRLVGWETTGVERCVGKEGRHPLVDRCPDPLVNPDDFCID